jgi:hypothetical protein
MNEVPTYFIVDSKTAGLAAADSRVGLVETYESGLQAMEHPLAPFSVPKTINPDLARVHNSWKSLKRGDADMPFWDDFKTSSLPELADRLMLVDVVDMPLRFRLNFLGQQVTHRYGSVISGKFVDELELNNPLEYLPSQCSATVESRTPTFYHHGTGASRTSQGSVSYSRLLLPMWGDGHIGMLLGAFTWH